MFERVRARKTEKGVAVFMRAYGTYHFLQEIIEFVNKFYLPPWRCLCVPTVCELNTSCNVPSKERHLVP
jgi:hypothetical protein